MDLAPEEDHLKIRKRIVRDLKGEIGPNIFDGTMMFSLHKITPDVREPRELTGSRFTMKDGQKVDETVKVTIKFTREVSPADQGYLQVMNIIMREAMKGLKLDLVKRDYFDSKVS